MTTTPLCSILLANKDKRVSIHPKAQKESLMDDQTQTPNNPPEPVSNPQNPPAPTYHSYREQRRAERFARRQARRERHTGRYFGVTGGMVLLLVGLILLLQNMGLVVPKNWWALFFLLPAIWFFIGAYDSYQDYGRLTRGTAAAFAIGILILVMTGILLLGIDFGLLWPIFLIVGGLILLGSALLPA